jgi:hypothetical protein
MGELTKDDLLHMISSSATDFQIPRTKYINDYLKPLLKTTREETYTAIEKYKTEYFKPREEVLKAINLQISPLYLGLYNATATVPTGSIDIKSILEKVKKNGLVSGDGIKVTEMNIRHGKFKTAIKYTSEYGLIGTEPEDFVSADFKAKVTKGGETMGASFSYYASGKVRFSGGYFGSDTNQPKELVKFFSKNYYPVPSSAAIKINNTTAEFKNGFKLKTDLVFKMFSDPFIPLEFINRYIIKTTYKKKLLYITFLEKSTKKKLFSLILADKGVIQIQGTIKVEESYDIAKKFFTALKNNDFLNVSPNQTQNVAVASKKKTKISKRSDNLPAPNITRRGTSCPMSRRPTPYSYTGACKKNCYVKPNPQGQPCCYSIPKSIEYSKNKIANAYRKAGVNVPKNVRNRFEFGPSTVTRPKNVANAGAVLKVRTYVNNKSGFKIDTRQCLRYTKVALVDIASRLHIILPSKLTKPILCSLIKGASKISNVNVKTSGKVVTGTNKTLRLGNRICETYDKNTLLKFARALGGDVSPESDKETICKLIQQLSSKKRLQLQTQFNKNKVAKNAARIKAVANQKLRNEANLKKAAEKNKEKLRLEKIQERFEFSEKVLKRVRMARNQVKENLEKSIGRTALRAEVNRLMSNINRAVRNGTIKIGKKGPLPSSVSKFKKAYTLNNSNSNNENFNNLMRGPR